MLIEITFRIFCWCNNYKCGILHQPTTIESVDTFPPSSSVFASYCLVNSCMQTILCIHTWQTIMNWNCHDPKIYKSILINLSHFQKIPQNGSMPAGPLVWLEGPHWWSRRLQLSTEARNGPLFKLILCNVFTLWYMTWNSPYLNTETGLLIGLFRVILLNGIKSHKSLYSEATERIEWHFITDYVLSIVFTYEGVIHNDTWTY